jgi:hypothetical protein
MANTVIQLKYSTVTATPTSLNVAEPAYSYTSNTLFIGSPAGTGAIAIGGKFYLDQQQNIYDYANAAFAQANTAGSSALVQYAAAHANAAYNQANTNTSDITVIQGVNLTQNTNITNAQNKADSSFNQANAAYNQANTNASDITIIQGVNLTQNTNITNAQNTGDAAFTKANGAFVQANTNASDITTIQGVNLTQNTNITAAQDTATAAFLRANNSLNANAGGVITGPVTVAANLTITGNLTVIGNTVTTDIQTLNIADPLIYLAANNYSGDAVEIGFAANYFDGSTQRHTGVFREASNKEFYVFDNYDKEPDANLIDINDASFRIATLHANLKSQLITLNGQNLQTYVDNAYNQANTAVTNAATAQTKADNAFHQANAAYAQANTNTSDITVIQGVNLTQNTNITAAQNKADSSFHQANAAYAKANTNASDIAVLQGVDLTQNTNITNAQNTADAAFTKANGAFDKANTDVTTISTTAGDYGIVTGGYAYVPGFKLEANGRISQANATLLQVDTTMITSGVFTVERGGTGANTFTTNGVLLGQGTSAFTTASSSTEGHVLTINSSGVPTFAHLSGGTF